MDVIIAKHAGFCEGVARAFKMVPSDPPVFMLGNLVHNKQVVDKLKAQGIRSVANLTEIPQQTGGTLLISAHGVGPDIYRQAKSLNLKIIDTTCPWVKKAQKIAKEFADNGRKVIIVGDRGHPEVKGLVGWSGGQAVVVEKAEDLAALSLSSQDKIGLLAQTTQAEEHFQNIVAAIKALAKDVKVVNTICGATSKRQRAAVEIAKKVDLMLVIGDKMSANTKRLTELCQQTGIATYQIETLSDVNKNWFAGKKKVGITAGASTPDWIIKEVIAAVKAF